MDRNVKDTKHITHIYRRVYFVRNGENKKMYRILLSAIATKNAGENDLNPRMKYIMVRLENQERTLVQEG